MIKKLVRHYIIDTLSLYLVSLVATGLIFEDGTKTLLLAGLGLTLATIFARPVINLLLLPLNLVTFGLFRWVSSAIALYLVELVVPGFNIAGFRFAGFTNVWIEIPGMDFSGWLQYIAFAFILSVITSIIYWVVK